MGVEYDFREGLANEKIVYKNTWWNWRACLFYSTWILIAYAWACAWFALFFYCYVYNETYSFWIFIGLWLLFAMVMVFFVVFNSIKHTRTKKHKQDEKAALAAKQEQLQKNKKKEQNENTDKANIEMAHLGTEHRLITDRI